MLLRSFPQKCAVCVDRRFCYFAAAAANIGSCRALQSDSGTAGCNQQRVGGASHRHARRVTDLLLQHGSGLTAEQIGVFDGLLLNFIQDCGAEVLTEIARKLASVPFAPPAVLRQLAIHCDVAVATPILTLSEKLSNEHLLEVATTRGQGTFTGDREAALRSIRY